MRKYKLGRRPRAFNQAVPSFASIRQMKSILLPALPTECHNADKLPANLGVMLNDRLGNCLIEGTLTVAPGLTKAYRVHYDGPVITIKTRTGKRLTTTCNHTVLTSRGFFAMHLLQEGDQVLSTSFPQAVARRMDNNFEDTPTLIEDVFKSYERITLASRIERQMRASIDFHGDAQFFKSQVHVVDTNRFLKSRDVPVFSEPESENSFIFTPNLAHSFYRSGAAYAHNTAIGATASSGLSFLSERSLLFRSPSIGTELAGFGSRPHLHASAYQNRSDTFPADANLPAELMGSFTGEITLDEIISIERSWYVGHVYDLSTIPQSYMANGIITHNCTIAGLYHAVQVWTADAQSGMWTEPDSCVLQAYEEADGYNPSDPSTDAGGVEQNVLSWASTTGLPMLQPGGGTVRSKLSAFVEVDPRNPHDICEAIYECGLAYIGFSVPTNIPEEAGSTWSGAVDLGPIEGGHCVVVPGWRGSLQAPVLDVISWGNRYTMDWAFWLKYVDECYALFSDLWVSASGKTPWGLDPTTLTAIMQAIREQT